MEKADGITSIPQGAFRELNKLEKLLLSGCSLTVIQKDTLQGLTQLKEVSIFWNVNLLIFFVESNCKNSWRFCIFAYMQMENTLWNTAIRPFICPSVRLFSLTTGPI